MVRFSLCLLFILFAVQDDAMSMLFPKKVCLFSGFTGQITFEGKPLPNVRVKRSYSFENKHTEEETTTDDQGYFTFESAWAKTRAPFIAQFVVEQHIYVYYQETEYQVWSAGKLLENEFGEFGEGVERLKSFSCELTEEIRSLRLRPGLALTNCRWE